ncbi:MAG: hypothetical protein WHS46_14210 [Desulfosoma sp.]
MHPSTIRLGLPVIPAVIGHLLRLSFALIEISLGIAAAFAAGYVQKS